MVVAGAGPVGLLPAAELRLGGVLERDAEVVRSWRVGSMGARSVNTPARQPVASSTRLRPACLAR